MVETEFGRVKRYLGHTDCKLSEIGINDAKQLAYVFDESKVVINSIFSSDLIRCKSTVNIIFPERESNFFRGFKRNKYGYFGWINF